MSRVFESFAHRLYTGVKYGSLLSGTVAMRYDPDSVNMIFDPAGNMLRALEDDTCRIATRVSPDEPGAIDYAVLLTPPDQPTRTLLTGTVPRD